MNKRKLKRASFFLIPILVGLAVWLYHFETAARYGTKMELRLPEIGVIVRTLRLNVPAAPSDQVYDGTAKAAGIEVPDGVTVSGITEATNTGEYEITLTLEDPETSEWSDGTNGTKKIIWKILPRLIPIPTAADLEHIYSGEVRRPSVSGIDRDYAEAVGVTETANAGWHEMAFHLKDTANTRWEDGTTADIPVSWLVGVCRIEETLYPSVTEAFRTNRSSPEHPVEMLCHWHENAVNADGEDWFSLNGFSLTSDGVTVENRGALTMLGGGPLRSEGSGSGNHACILNTGVLYVNAGEYTASYSGNATAGAEVYALWNRSGTMTVRDGTFFANGGKLAADGIYAEGGSVTVNGGAFHAENNGAGHGAYAVWVDDGTVNVVSGTFECSAAAEMTRGYFVTKGTLVLSGGSTAVTAGAGKPASIAGVTGSGVVRVTGGTHSVTGYASGAGFSSSDGGTLEIGGGTATIRQMAGSGGTVDGILVSGGSLRMSGGSISLYSDSTVGTSGIGVSSGTAAVTGGSLSVELSVDARAYGVNMKAGSCTVEGLELSVRALSGRAYGFIKSSIGSLEVRTGEFLVAGGYASTGEGNSASSKIVTPPANENCAFEIQYKTGWSAGTNWTNAPYVRSAVQIRSRGLFTAGSSSDSVEYGPFAVKQGALHVFYVTDPDSGAGAARTVLGAIDVSSGSWSVTEESEAGGGKRRLILRSTERAAGSPDKTADVPESEGAAGGSEDEKADAPELISEYTPPAPGAVIVGTSDAAGQLRRVTENCFVEALSESWKECVSEDGLLSPAPAFGRIGFAWLIREGSPVSVRAAKDAFGKVVEIVIEAE